MGRKPKKFSKEIDGNTICQRCKGLHFHNGGFIVATNNTEHFVYIWFPKTKHVHRLRMKNPNFDPDAPRDYQS